MSQLRQIVSSEDVLIGHKHRTELDLVTDIYRVSALWITNTKGEVLLAQRGLGGNNGPGLWGPAVAGTVEQGETYETNIYKEAPEEIGLTGYTFVQEAKVKITGLRNFFCQWFSLVADINLENLTLNKREVESVKWISEAELIDDVTMHKEKYIDNFDDTVQLFSHQQGPISYGQGV